MGLCLILEAEDKKIRQFTNTLGLPNGGPVANFLVDLIPDIEADLGQRLSEVSRSLRLPESHDQECEHADIVALLRFFQRLRATRVDPRLPRRYGFDQDYESKIVRCTDQLIMALEDLREAGMTRLILGIV